MATEQHALWPQRQKWDRSQLHLRKKLFQAELPLEGLSSPIPGAVQVAVGSFPSRRPLVGFSPWEGINNSYHLFCLFYVSGTEVGMVFTLFLTFTTSRGTYDPVSQISQTEDQK